MRSAAARVASRRGSSMRIVSSPRQGAASSAKGTSVVFPAPGGATTTAFRPAARVASSVGSAVVTGRSGDMLAIWEILRHMRVKADHRGFQCWVC